MMEGRKDSSEFNKWFFTTNNLLENPSSRHIFGETSKAIIPKIKSPQNKYLGKLFEDDLYSRRNIYERKRSTTVGEREKYVYINKQKQLDTERLKRNAHLPICAEASAFIAKMDLSNNN